MWIGVLGQRHKAAALGAAYVPVSRLELRQMVRVRADSMPSARDGQLAHCGARVLEEFVAVRVDE